MARPGVGARDKPGHDGGGGGGDRSRAGTADPMRPRPPPVMAGLVPATHAAPSRTGPRRAPAWSEDPRWRGPAWVPGTSPGMTVEGAEENGRGRARRIRCDHCPSSRHGRACPGHPRRAEPHRPRRVPAYSEAPRWRGPAWVPGTSPGMTVEGAEENGRGGARRIRCDHCPSSRHGRACPGHPRRAEPNRPRTAPARSEDPRRRGPAWVPGTSPGMTVEGAEETGRGRARRIRSAPRP